MEPRITLVTLDPFLPRRARAPAARDAGERRVLRDARHVAAALRARGVAEDAAVSPGGSGFRGFTLAHKVRSPEAVDRLLADAVAAGATLVKPGQKVFWGGYSGYFADPDGFLWEVAWNPHLPIE